MRTKGIGGQIHGQYRVGKGKGLPMTRSIGDKELWQSGVINRPDIRVDVLSGCIYMIIGSDGVWEYLSNECAINLIFPLFKNNMMKRSAIYLVSYAKKQWEKETLTGIDDITAIVVKLRSESQI